MTMQNSAPRFLIHTLGCKVNQYDSERIRTQLLQRGMLPLSDDDRVAPDLIVVNTCSVTSESDRKGRQAIRRMTRQFPLARLAVTGCYSERKPLEVGAIDGVDDVVPIENQERWVERLSEELGWGCSDQDGLWERSGFEQFQERTRAFIKIQDGCDLKCTFCSIPTSRGIARSRPLDEVIAEARVLIAQGYGELVLCGICIGHYGRGLGYELADLVCGLAVLDGIKRIRISSLEPQDCSDVLLDVMVKHNSVVCPHLHLPIQAGANRILRRMKRPYTQEFFLERVETARARIPDFEISTDIMVGFPDEQEDEFQQTLDAVRAARFCKVHSFPFSVREEAPAARMKNQWPKDVIQERRRQLDAVADEVADSVKQNYIGKEVAVLVESSDDTHATGYTPNYIRCEIVTDNMLHRGDVVHVLPHSLNKGRLIC